MSSPPAHVEAPTPMARSASSRTTTLWALPNPVYRASAVNVTGGPLRPRSRVRSNTCIPWADASLTTKATVPIVLTSRHDEFEVAVGRSPSRTGDAGTDTSTNAVPFVSPTSAISAPVSGSVQPQTSLAAAGAVEPAATNAPRGRWAMRSTPSQG